MTKVRVGLIGCGFIAELHMQAYRRVYGLAAEVTSVSARGDAVLDFARRHRIAATYRDWRALVADPAIDVVDICTPPALHAKMIVAAMRAGKHVICEKPFAGYFGRPGDATPVGRQVPKSVMYERVLEEMAATAAAIRETGRLFMYAEDWIYAPAVAKTAEIVRASGDRILFVKAEESHSGSHAAHAGEWAMTGGGSLFANITPNNHLTSYLTDEGKLASVYITEKVDRKTGWQFVSLEEESTRGYLQEIQDFMECAASGREPISGLALAEETIKIIYAGYWSAEEGRRITL